MADIEVEVEDTNTLTTFLELILDIIEIFEPQLCLSQEIFWMKLPRVIEETYEIPENLDQEWNTLKILFKRLEHYFQTHTNNCYQISLSHVLKQLKTVMVSGFKTCFSAKLQQELLAWCENCKDALMAMEGLSSSSHPTTRTSMSTTTVLTQEDHVDVTGEKKSRKRKITNLEDAFSDLVDAEELETSTYPIGNVSYYISQRKDDALSHRILTEK